MQIQGEIEAREVDVDAENVRFHRLKAETGRIKGRASLVFPKASTLTAEGNLTLESEALDLEGDVSSSGLVTLLNTGTAHLRGRLQTTAGVMLKDVSTMTLRGMVRAAHIVGRKLGVVALENKDGSTSMVADHALDLEAVSLLVVAEKSLLGEMIALACATSVVNFGTVASRGEGRKWGLHQSQKL